MQERIKQIFQVVLLVNNLEETLGNWKRMVEFDEQSIKTGVSGKNSKGIYKGREVACSVKYAEFDLGGVDMVLVEPLHKEGGDPYSDCLKAKGQGFHHLGVFAEDYDDLLGHFEAKGFAPIYEERLDDGRCFRLFDFTEETGMTVAPWTHMCGPCSRQKGLEE